MDDTTRAVTDGEIIFKRDEPSDFACVVDTGFIEIITEVDGAEDTIAVLGPGELFGEMGVLDGKPRSATAKARGPGRIREFEARDFLERVRGDAPFASAIMGTLVARLRRGAVGSDTDDAPTMPPDTPLEPSQTNVPEAATTGATAPRFDQGGPQRARRDAEPNEVAFDKLPRVLLTPTVGDENGLHGAAIEAWLDDAEAFAAITLPDERLADPACPEPERAERARHALCDAKAGVALLSRVAEHGTNQWVEFSVITEWPDDESRVGGFSAMDRFALPVPADDTSIRFLRALITAAVPGDAVLARETLATLMPDSFDIARDTDALASGSLPATITAHQFIAYGNAAARLGGLETNSIRLYDAADAYRAAFDALPRDDRLGRGLARLHLAVTLNAAADRDRRDQDRVRARDAAMDATRLLDPVAHVYPYLTANARLGAILYRMATRSQSLTVCKEGIDAFNRALAVCDKQGMPDPWADTMNGLGQLLILLGRLSRNTEFLTWAAQVCHNAMEVRNRDYNPMGWARTLNNHATALFLIARASNDTERLTQAASEFERAEAVFRDFGIITLAETAHRNLGLARAGLAGPDQEELGKWWVD